MQQREPCLTAAYVPCSIPKQRENRQTTKNQIKVPINFRGSEKGVGWSGSEIGEGAPRKNTNFFAAVETKIISVERR